MFSQLFHRKGTEDAQVASAAKLRDLQGQINALKTDLAIMNRNIADLEEKHSRRLSSLRAQVQNRKDGKFGSSDAPESSNGEPSLVDHSELDHAKIRALAREKGVLA